MTELQFIIKFKAIQDRFVTALNYCEHDDYAARDQVKEEYRPIFRRLADEYNEGKS